jgi:hypothetical protein
MWFHPSHIKIKKPLILIEDLHGYVLPHASTAHSGGVLSHSLRFIPQKYFSKILIVFYPASPSENVEGKMFHEQYVVEETLKYVINNVWKLNYPITFQGFNIRDEMNPPYFNARDTLLVISADFSHHLSMQHALSLENCAANAIMHKQLKSNINIGKCIKVIDHVESFKQMYRFLPHGVLQWIGRSRSKGLKGVGYLSFLIRSSPQPSYNPPDGMFVTAYDEIMQQRECLGQWYNSYYKWSKRLEKDFVKSVIDKAKTTSRLTGGVNINIPVKFYTITYLYKTERTKFIRGYHGIKWSAFYLPTVFLEHTYENGTWIKPTDKHWIQKKGFSLGDTLKKLQQKAGKYTRRKKNSYTLYTSRVSHHKLK